MTNNPSLEIAQREYKAGIAAFESGKYRESVENLEKASALVNRNSRFGGEVQIWLVTAYEAAGRTKDAIALGEALIRHPFPDTSKEARRIVYILKAPQLQRPQEWMTQIPDLTAIADSNDASRFVAAKSNNSGSKQPLELEIEDLSQLNTRDNRFIWLALLIIGLTLASLLWFGFHN